MAGRQKKRARPFTLEHDLRCLLPSRHKAVYQLVSVFLPLQSLRRTIRPVPTPSLFLILTMFLFLSLTVLQKPKLQPLVQTPLTGSRTTRPFDRGTMCHGRDEQARSRASNYKDHLKGNVKAISPRGSKKTTASEPKPQPKSREGKRPRLPDAM